MLRSPQICAAGMPSAEGELGRKKEENAHQRHDNVGEIIENNPLKDDTKFAAGKIQAENYFPVPIDNMSTVIDEQTEIQLVKDPTTEQEQLSLQAEHNISSMDPVNNQEDDSVTGLMHPSRTPYQVMWDGQVGHEKYRTTHDDYNAPKDIEKGEAPFEPEKCLNAAGKYNLKGVWVRCMCDWHKKEASDLSSKIEADYVDRYKSQIGKTRNPNSNIDSVPKGFAFGLHSQRESCGMEELSKDSDCPPCVFRRDFYKWMAALNRCRNALKERDFDFKKFHAALLDRDEENTGFLPVDEVYDICAQKHITFHKEEIEALLKVLKIVVDDKLEYGKFIEMIDVNKPTIDVVPLHDLPKHNQHYETSSHEADYLITNNADLPPAGVISSYNFNDEPDMGRKHFRSSGEESLESPLNFKK